MGRRGGSMSTSGGIILRALGGALVAATVLAPRALAQTADIAVSGLPAEPLVGEQFCFTTAFSNTDPATGFGPYLVAVFDPGFTDAQVDFVDVAPAIELIGEFGVDDPIVDPVSGTPLTGDPGATAYVVRYPVGSVNQGDPELPLDSCGSLQAGVDIGVPLDVTIIPGFEFGDTPTGDNGAILNTANTVNTTVTPQLARIEKSNSAPEGERPPGPDFPFQYTWSVDISRLSTIRNLVLEDTLPASVQWTGDPISVNAAIGVNCQVAVTPNAPPTPGGQTVVTCGAATGTQATDDLVVSVPVYIVDILDETVPDSELITNTVNFDYEFEGQPFANSDDSDVLAVHAAIQKSASGGNLPGDLVTYAVNFQVTDYPGGAGSGADSFIISDILPDSLTFLDTVELVIGGSTVPITASQGAGPGPGETSLIWDVGAAAGGLLANGAVGALRYQARINEFYTTGIPVSASDTLTNAADLDFALVQGGTGSNGSTAPVNITDNTPDKVILDPGPGVEIQPGQDVTFRLTLQVPAGNTENVVFVDVLPQPVFDVTSPVPTVTVPTDAQFFQPPTPPAVTTNPANNSVRIEFGDINTDQGATIAVDITATVTDTPFADNLFLTNILSASYENATGVVTQTVQAAALFVGAPELQVTKGVLTTDNPNASLSPTNGGDPTAELIDSDARDVDAADNVTYVLTVENVGGQSAYNVTITDPAIPGLSCNPTPLQVTNGVGATLGFSGDLQAGLVLDAPLPGNDDNPSGGGAPFSTDTALVQVSCTVDASVEPGQVLDNTAAATWTATPGASTPFPAVEDSASLAIARPQIAKSLTGISPQYGAAYNAAGVHIGEIVSYRIAITVPEGVTEQLQLDDLLDAGLAIEDLDNGGTVDAGDVSITLPAGMTSTASSIQVLDEGGGNTGVNRRLQVDLGTVTNSNSSNGSAEQILIEYQARVNNSANNVDGQQRRNQAELSWLDAQGGTPTTSIAAPPVTVLEPQLSITKTLTPGTGDGTSEPVVELVITHSGASTGDAFDIALSDVMPDFTDGGGTTFDLLDIQTGTVSADSACPAFSLAPTATTDRLDAEWEVFPLGATCTITFTTDVLDIIPAGARITNCANIFWESMEDSSQPVDQLPLGFERTGSAGDPGELNDYSAESCAPFKILDVGIAKTVLGSDQPQTDNISGTPPETESLTIGETVVFELVVTLPESPVFDLSVSDLLPTTGMVLELLDAQHISNGQDIFPQGGSNGDSLNPGAPTLTDTNGDGVNDRAELAYGNVAHSPLDGTDDDDRIRIQVTAKVLDLPVNANGDLDENTATASYQITPGGDRANKSDTFGIELVEPQLQVDKTADVSEIEAGDTVTYSLIVSHAAASRINAEDVSLSDILPPELALVASSLTEGQCDVSPDTLTEGADRIDATWSEFPLDATCELQFQAVVDISAITGSTITNPADIAWTSLQGQGDADDRDYQASDTWDVIVSLPGLFKVIAATDSDDTPFTLGEPVTPLTIGETVTFLVSASIPDGTTREVTVTDVLPADARLLVDTAATELLRIGSDISLPTGPSAGDPPVCVEAGTGAGTYTEQCAWTLGDVINQPDTRADPDLEDQIVFRIVATVIDAPENSGVPGVDDNVANIVRLDSPDAQLAAQAVFDIVEPLLSLDKVTENGGKVQAVDAGDIHRFTLTVSHTPDSTANARALSITDTLDPNMLWQGNVTTACPGLVTSDPGVGNSGVVTFTFDTLPLSLGSCEVSFDVLMDPANTPAAGVFPNTAALAWESDPDSILAASRPGSDDSSARLFNLSDAFLEKDVVATSVPGTTDTEGDPALQDATIGELVEYRITVYFAEGTSTDVVLTDTLQSTGGLLEFEAGEVLFIGDNIMTEDGAPTISNTGGVITLDYGEVVNTADSVVDENDTIVYRLQARVADDAANVSGGTLNNQTLLEFDGVLGGADTRSADVDIDIVEPELSLTKAFTDLTASVATVELTLTNNGIAPAYDISISDDLDEDVWEAGSVTPLSVPPGFLLSESSDDLMLVTLASDPPGPQVPTPDQVLVPGESLTVTFEVTLREDRTPADIAQIPNTADALANSLPGPQAGFEREYGAQSDDTLDLPVLTLGKTVDSTTAAPGDTLTYTLTLDNTGAAAATNVLITDTPDPNGEYQPGSVMVTGPTATVDIGNAAGDTSVQVSVPNVPAGSTVEVTYAVRIPLPYPDGSDATAVPQRLENQAEATSEELPPLLSDSDPGTPDTAEPTVVDIIADPVMTIDKDDQLIFTAPGETIFYSIQFGNAGDQDASGVVLTETVPTYTRFNAAASTAGWSCAGTGPGALCSFTVSGGVAGQDGGSVLFAVDVDNNIPPGIDTISNQVFVTEDGQEFGSPDDTPSTDDATEITPLDPLRTGPDLIINKDDGGISVVPGQVFSYRLDYVNDGNQTATGVFLTETVPPQTSFNAAASTPGWSCADGSPTGTVCTLTVGNLPPADPRIALFGLQVIAPLPAGIDITSNTARIEDDGNNSPLPQVDNDNDVTPIVAAPELAITKATATETALIDETILYDIEYINQGNQDATGVVIREVVPPGTEFSEPDSAPTIWSCPDRAPGGTVCTIDIGTLAAGDGGMLTFALEVIEEPGTHRVINLIEINNDGSNGVDPVLRNNADTVITPFPAKNIPVMDARLLALLALGLMLFGLRAGVRQRAETR